MLNFYASLRGGRPIVALGEGYSRHAITFGTSKVLVFRMMAQLQRG